MDTYLKWSFKDNPFDTTSLTSDDVGNDLIAGREEEIGKFLRRLYNQPQIVTLEGENGIGKTSLINVGVFRATLKHMRDRSLPFLKSNPLFIPCAKIFQLYPDIKYEDFIQDVFTHVAQTIIKDKESLKKIGIKLPKDIDDVDKWINLPYTTSYQGSIGLATAQFGIGSSIETSTTSGFEKNGLRETIIKWLLQIFPTKNSGGIVCVIDNLELLEKSSSARRIIENMRDSLLTTHGIRWVFCGSSGIVTSILSSPRIEGLLHDPIEIGGILSIYLKDILQKRIDKYKTNESYYLPITESSFKMLYDILKKNIRNTLKYANDFCLWVADDDKQPQTNDEKEDYFVDWLFEKSSKYKHDIEIQLKPKTLKLFLDVIKLRENFGFDDFELFEFETQQHLKLAIRDLETLGLLVCVIDENDHRKKSIQITPKGCFIAYGYSMK